MRKLLLPVLLVLLCAGAVWAAGNQAYLGIFAETRAQVMAGLPKMPKLPPGMDMSMLPPEAAAVLSGRPTRSLQVRLWSPGLAPQDASAYLEPPAGLGLGKRLDLGLYRPQPGQTEAGGSGPMENPDFTIKIYWGSSPTVKPGQPKVIHLSDLTGAEKEVMRREANEAGKLGSYFYKPDWTTAYWPTGKQPGRIGEQASLVGHYALTTTYTGDVALDDPRGVDFLAPITLTSPDLSQRVSFDDAITLQWNAIPALLGQHAMIMGMEGKNTLILWTSSETGSTAAFADWDYLEMAKVRELVDKGVLMKPDQTQAVAPAGIFKDADVVTLMMIGYGPGTALPQGQPLPRLQTKTTLMAMLGGRRMRGLGAMGGARGDE